MKFVGDIFQEQFPASGDWNDKTVHLFAQKLLL